MVVSCSFIHSFFFYDDCAQLLFLTSLYSHLLDPLLNTNTFTQFMKAPNFPIICEGVLFMEIIYIKNVHVVYAD